MAVTEQAESSRMAPLTGQAENSGTTVVKTGRLGCSGITSVVETGQAGNSQAGANKGLSSGAGAGLD